MTFEIIWVLYNERIGRYVYAKNTATMEAADIRDALVLVGGLPRIDEAPIFRDNGARLVGVIVREAGSLPDFSGLIVETKT